MKTQIDLENWERREHFNFFKSFDEPFFGVCVDIDVTNAYARAKELNVSFFLYYLHKSLKAVNEVKEFRYRVEGDQIFDYDRIDASPTINRPDGSFGYAYITYFADFKEFNDAAMLEVERVRKSKTLVPSGSSQNVIHYSSIPWFRFTSVSHARNFKVYDSVPKITFGKITDDENSKIMPVSIHANHALMDGSHVAKHLNLFQDLLND